MDPVEFADNLKAMKVLLIDDDKHMRHSLGYFLKQKISAFAALVNAEEALERLDNEPYDIVICDYRLPGMNGLTFFEILGRTSPDTIRILITAYANKEIEAEAIRVGVHDFIRKPFDGKTIEKSLTMLIQKHKLNIRGKQTVVNL
jgi:DNA-binding NtrC family response regulator